MTEADSSRGENEVTETSCDVPTGQSSPFPTDRDIIFGDGSFGHKANMLSQDLISLHHLIWEGSGRDWPEEISEVEEMATRIFELLKNGKKNVLAGLKDVPKPFLIGSGKFFAKQEGSWVELGDADAKTKLQEALFLSFQQRKNENDAAIVESMSVPADLKEQFFAFLGDKSRSPSKTDESGKEGIESSEGEKGERGKDGGAGGDDEHKEKDGNDAMEESSPTTTAPKTNGGAENSTLTEDNSDKEGATIEILPRATDVILLEWGPSSPDGKVFEDECGNNRFFNLASQHVTSESSDAAKRLNAAISLLLSKGASFYMEKTPEEQEMVGVPRYLIRTREAMKKFASYEVMDAMTATEFTLIFVFEVFLEKEIACKKSPVSASVPSTSAPDYSKPSNIPIAEPTAHDVLFGRGGMTNSHPGNRRFRDVIALHRPDYIRAIKNDKPNVARKIVRAIRSASPPGRFLKKKDDGKWYDVGDRCAAEKTSQGLRERSNAEKRERLALREAYRIQKEDKESNKKPKLNASAAAAANATMALVGGSGSFLGVAPQHLNYVGASIAALGVPLSLGVNDKKLSESSLKNIDNKTYITDEIDLSRQESLPPNAVDKDGNILVTDYDILCGRGGLTNHHKGNKRFRDIVALHRPDYVRAPKVQKPSVARVIVRAIRNGDPPGRFLRKDESTGKWVDIGDKRAAEKTSQALREKSHEERAEVQKKGDANSTDGDRKPNEDTKSIPIASLEHHSPDIKGKSVSI